MPAANKDYKNRQLFLPQLVEEDPGTWVIVETDIREAAVNLQKRIAYVPKALTRAHRKARLHELGHVKYTPRDYRASIQGALSHAASRGEVVDPTTVLRISKMLEENRIDWLLWDWHGVDIREAREQLDWGSMQAPTDTLAALNWVLQLAWTVWASRGLPARIHNPPPARTPDPETAAFFDQVWAVVANHDPSLGLSTALIRGCLAIYDNPTHDCRDRVASELATFFPPPEEEEKPPPLKPEAKQAQDDAEEEEKKLEQSRSDEDDADVGSERIDCGHYEIHDHTTGVRRPSMRIARKETPQYAGTKLTFPHRYMLDKAVFARRVLTEAGIMIDASGSMQWNQSDLDDLLAKLPAVTVGIYGGTGQRRDPNRTVYGRICVLAKRGRFSKYDPQESQFNRMNDIDLEALQLLATWPKPRLWLSDGEVCGGKHAGPHPDPDTAACSRYMHSDGALVELVNQFMRRHEILRVNNREDMQQAISRKRVTLYRSAVNYRGEFKRDQYPPEMLEQPVKFQL